MAFCWFLAFVEVLWFPPAWGELNAPEASVLIGPSVLSLVFMVCSLIHVVLLATVKFKTSHHATPLDSEDVIEPEPDGSSVDQSTPESAVTAEATAHTKT